MKSRKREKSLILKRQLSLGLLQLLLLIHRIVVLFHYYLCGYLLLSAASTTTVSLAIEEEEEANEGRELDEECCSFPRDVDCLRVCFTFPTYFFNLLY